jgi:alanine racemase
VMTPWRPFGAALEVPEALDRRVVHTVSRVDDLRDLRARRPDARFVLEQLTSMRRHGFDARALRQAGAELGPHGSRHLQGVALHLPLANGSHLAEVRRLVDELVGAGLTGTPAGRRTSLWVSHLSDAELATLRTTHGDFDIRPRVGTSLWLGDRSALRVTARVLDVHHVERGETFGYRGRSAPKSGHVVVVSGGTAHGIGLEAPTGDSSLKARAATLARGGLDAVGFVRSPFTIDGKQRLFAEPPHMQASMLFLPSGAHVPAVGDAVDVRVRYTATTFDRVEIA